MSLLRSCSKPSCADQAVATLTYVYADCTVVLGPLATVNEPHAYDLCATHADKLTVPRGWDVIRLDFGPDRLAPSHDDLEALADAVREAAARPKVSSERGKGVPQGSVEVSRRGHLRVLRAAD